MSKFNRKTPDTATAAAQSVGIPLPPPAANHAEMALRQHVGHEGAPGFLRTPEGELFMLAVVNMVGEDTFYEKAAQRDGRYRDLVRAVAVSNPEWLVQFIGWLRREANMRSASGVAAVEMVMARRKAKLSGHSRQAVAAACARADEPGELLSYWRTLYGPARGVKRSAPIPLLRGLADAMVKLYNEYSFIKYDSDTAAFRMGDVVDMVRPATYRPDVRGTFRYDLFRHMMDVRHNRGNDIPATLPGLRKRRDLLALPAGERRDALRTMHTDGVLDATMRQACMTWQQIAGWLPGGMDAEAWEWIIPNMGYDALLKNLRNFDRAGISEETAAKVAAILADPANVAKSRLFPYRFLAAYQHTDTERWRVALEKAVNASLGNVPALPGRTLVLVDTSYSMQNKLSEKSKMTCVMAGALFGVAMAARADGSELWGFANGDRLYRHDVRTGAGLLRATEAFCAKLGHDGYGTNIAKSIKKTYNGHDRVVVITDGQTFAADHYGYGRVTDAVPADVPLYGFNLGGYAVSAFDTTRPNRYELAGLSDATFKVMAALETGGGGLLAIGGTPEALTA